MKNSDFPGENEAGLMAMAWLAIPIPPQSKAIRTPGTNVQAAREDLSVPFVVQYNLLTIFVLDKRTLVRGARIIYRPNVLTGNRS